MTTLAAFLEERIREDEDQARQLLRDLVGQVTEQYAGKPGITPDNILSAEMSGWYDGRSKRRSFARGQQIARLAGPTRALAEAAAKRRILADRTRIDRSANPDQWSAGYSDANYAAIQALAAIYAEHRDYKPEWATPMLG